MCGTFWLTTKSAKFTKRLDFSDFFTFHFLCLIVLRDLRITIVQNLRSLRKFSGHCSYVAVLNEKIRPHHEVHEGHEGFRIFQTPNFVIFVSFVVNIFFPIWLRRSRAGSSVVHTSPQETQNSHNNIKVRAVSARSLYSIIPIFQPLNIRSTSVE